MLIMRNTGQNRMQEQEHLYKTLKGAGAASIAIGVFDIVVGISTGILLIIAGAKLLARKAKLLF